MGSWWRMVLPLLAALGLGVTGAAASEVQEPRPSAAMAGAGMDARMLVDLEILRDLELLRQLDLLRKIEEVRTQPPPRGAKAEEKGKP